MRSTEEWIGKNDDQTPPPRVRIRVFDSAGGKCHLCGRKISAGEYWQCDHVIALCNGGINRESNLLPACRNCCYRKTGEDIAEKSAIAEKRKKHLLPKEPKGRGFQKPPGMKFDWKTGRYQKADRT
jgi:5-methylcytosine-specific restriction endonuclease McrA